MLDIARCPWCSLTCRIVESGPDQASGGEGGEERENALNERECGSLSTLVGVRPTRSPGELPEATGPAVRGPVNSIALPQCSAAADAETTMGERETCSLIASDGPCSRSIARLKAKDDALTPAPIHLTFGQVDLGKNRKPRWGYSEGGQG